MKEYLKMADVFKRQVSDVEVSFLTLDHHNRACDEYAAYAINSHDELVAMNKELLEHLERCAKELASMIDQHNEHNMDDNSWMYDHQTPWEAMQVVIKANGGK